MHLEEFFQRTKDIEMGLRNDASWILVEHMRGTRIDVKLYSDACARQSPDGRQRIERPWVRARVQEAVEVWIKQFMWLQGSPPFASSSMAPVSRCRVLAVKARL